MNAKVVVGVGNIYANESLFKAGIHPHRQANRISLKRYSKLAQKLKMCFGSQFYLEEQHLKTFMTRTGTQVTLKQNLRFTEKRVSLAAPALGPLNT